MLLDFWSSVTHWLFSIAIAAHRKTILTAQDEVNECRDIIRLNRNRISHLEESNIELQNYVDEMQDWIDGNTDENIIL